MSVPPPGQAPVSHPGRGNPLAAALAERRFCYVVELVASALTRESRVLEVASRLARVPQLVAGSITSYAGGALGHDPTRVGTAARARGLTPNIHLTCVGQDREGLRKTLEDLHALGIHNVFALTGDYPGGRREGATAGTGVEAPTPIFDLDSVQLTRLIGELRQRGMPFHVSVAVSPFKYVEADCVYQYVKLEKKIAAGADLAITQVGWDARKFAELPRYLDERGLATPILGNVYVLGPRAAEKMATGQPPGCWVSPALLETIRAESRHKDGGLRARLDRAARMVAVLRGLGYAGAYIGGTHDPDQIQWIIRRADDLAARWEELAAELSFGRDGFYVYAAEEPARSGQHRAPPERAAGPREAPGLRRPRPLTSEVAPAPTAPPAATSTGDASGGRRPSKRPLVPWLLDALGRILGLTRETGLRRLLERAAAWVDRRPGLAAAVERAELAVKQPLFGCQACGNCVLGHMEYVCPQTCPKQMRNGPCGGTDMGQCEVIAAPCIWVSVYKRAKAAGRVDDLLVYIPAPDRSLEGTSSWINYFLHRDSRPVP